MEDTELELGLGFPAGNADIIVPLSANSTIDFGFQSWLSAANLSSGFWFKTQQSTALRLGGTVGIGDLIGDTGMSLYYAGPALHYQWVWDSGRNPDWWTTLTLGGEMLVHFPRAGEKPWMDRPDHLHVVEVPAFYVDVDLRKDRSIRAWNDNSFFLASGARVFLPVMQTNSFVLPMVSVGLRL